MAVGRLSLGVAKANSIKALLLVSAGRTGHSSRDTERLGRCRRAWDGWTGRNVAPIAKSVAWRLVGIGACALVTANLIGCAGVSEQSATAAFVEPGRFDIYNCQQIAYFTNSTRTRLTELEQVMARSAQGPGGEFVNAIAYRSEYLQARGELEQLSKASADKQCAGRSEWSSERAVF